MSQDVVLFWLKRKFPGKFSKRAVAVGAGINVGTVGAYLQKLFRKGLIEKSETTPNGKGSWVFWSAKCGF